MGKLIVFDLDGVLVDSKEIHFNALNQALAKVSEEYIISKEDQENIYEAISTRQKLKILTERKGLSEDLYEQIFKDKQEITIQLLNSLTFDKDLHKYFSILKSYGFYIAVASNSIRVTIDVCLKSLGIESFVDLVLSNEDVKYPKPHPEIYWKSMSFFGVTSNDTIIFEDSIVGKLAAKQSGSRVIEINNRKDLTIEKIEKAINMLKNTKTVWEDENLNVLIPMAGAGTRFSDAGYVFPKPLIDVNGMPMIEAIVKNLGIKAHYIYVVQKEHYNKYSLHNTLNLITPGCDIIPIDGLTDGAAITCITARHIIDNDKPLIIANSDQIVDWDVKDFMYSLTSKNADGGIATFKSTHPKWSYAKIDEHGLVLEVAEKRPISDNATVGIYYWKHGSDFIKYADQMIGKNIKVNNEFYTCPVFNEAIEDGKRVYALEVKKMWGIGTPEDLNNYLRHNND